MLEKSFSDEKRIFNRVFLVIILYIVFSNLAGLIVNFFQYLSPAFAGFVDKRLIVVNGLITIFLDFPFALVLFKHIPVIDRPVQRSLKTSSIVKLFTICYAGMFVGSNISSIFLKFMNMGSENYIVDMIVGSGTLEKIIFIAVLAPVTEEIIFRKLVIDRLKFLGDATAVVMSALIFALMHGNFFQLFYAFIVGYIFAVIYTNTGKISYTILIHIIINFLGSVGATWILKTNAVLISVYGLLLIGIVIIGIYYLIVFILRCRPENAKGPACFKMEWLGFVFRSYSFDLFMVISLLIAFFRTGQ